MFPLPTKIFPPDAAALRDALEESLRRVVTAESQLVTVEDKNYPTLQAIRISLDRARAIWRRPQRVQPVGLAEPALQVEQFEISGRPIFVEGAALDFTCTARDVEIGQGREANGDLFLLLQNAVEGNVAIMAAVADLETLLLAGAKAEASKQGITVEEVRLELRSRTNRALAGQVRVRARKLFLSATVQLNGELEIDDRLNARISGLTCNGEGALGALACNFVGPYLERLNHREFSLLALPLGEMQLREINIVAGDKLSVTASFGGAA
jgi:hypothetical protein